MQIKLDKLNIHFLYSCSPFRCHTNLTCINLYPTFGRLAISEKIELKTWFHTICSFLTFAYHFNINNSIHAAFKTLFPSYLIFLVNCRVLRNGEKIWRLCWESNEKLLTWTQQIMHLLSNIHPWVVLANLFCRINLWPKLHLLAMPCVSTFKGINMYIRPNKLQQFTDGADHWKPSTRYMMN